MLVVPSSNSSGMVQKRVSEIDSEALAVSAVKVPARPWTEVAGDGIVSSLVSSFFKYDDAFVYAFFDRDLLVRGMRSGAREYCSSCLVDALCAVRSFTSDRLKLISKATNTDLGARFLSEAKKHLDVEIGKASLATAQGIFLLFLVSCCDGTNWARQHVSVRCVRNAPSPAIESTVHHAQQANP
ncbi:hypothetical protein B0H67DRAFT_119718 [Lasiosphaeris hirsuta]|uniref:Uncharacterized protein n=1 Tax=Lasiosphaeris hirsuta TaxID=260670 RepID=A0AA40AZU9_9PEZI|nr:hypothetical protein B0H67DRAFT_119718 [Lasiosphaeris hirsuta]